MDSRWFAEDRKGAPEDLAEAIEKSTVALKNSTLLVRRLKGILEAEIESADRKDEDFSNPTWEREAVANISRRKALREVIKLLP